MSGPNLDHDEIAERVFLNEKNFLQRNLIVIFNITENSATLMNSKITGGLPVFEESRRNHLVSIQLHGKHFCTGIIFSKNAVISTANCALQILSYLMVRDAQGNPIVRVCFAHILDDSSRCTSIWRIAKHYLFKANSVQDLNGKPSKQENIGLILVSLSSHKLHGK